METRSSNIQRSIEMITVGYFFSKYIEDGLVEKEETYKDGELIETKEY